MYRFWSRIVWENVGLLWIREHLSPWVQAPVWAKDIHLCVNAGDLKMGSRVVIGQGRSRLIPTLKKKEQLTLSFSVPKMLAKYSAILLADLAASEISISYGWQHLKAAWRLTNGVWFHCCLTNGTPGKLTNISHRHWTIDVDGNLGHWNFVAVSGAFFHFLVPAIPRV